MMPVRNWHLVEDGFLLWLHYVYDEYLRKYRELEDLNKTRDNALVLMMLIIKPPRCSECRWISNKLQTLMWVLSQFWTCTYELLHCQKLQVVPWSPLKNAKLKEYNHNLVEAKYLLGCASFVILLSHCRFFKLHAKHWGWHLSCPHQSYENLVDWQACLKSSCSVSMYTTCPEEDCHSVRHCIKSRLFWSNLQLITDSNFQLY